ncbi:MAG: endonuclease MutS2 [Candidatus Melainabacteria bacterium]
MSHPPPAINPTLPDSLDCLEWPRLMEHLQRHCLTPYGLAAWQQPFLTAGDEAALIESIETHMAAADSLRVIVTRYPIPTLSPVADCRPVIQRLAHGGELTLSEAALLVQALTESHRLTAYLERHRDIAKPETSRGDHMAEALGNLLTVLPDLTELMTSLATGFEPDGQLREDATPELARLFAGQRQKRRQTEQFLTRLLQDSAYAGMFQGDTITEREGRMVLPVRATHKNQVDGLVHGASATGGTYFIEPAQAVALNNAVIALEGDIAAEITRFLKVISTQLHPQTDDILAFFDGVGALDRHLAAACLARDLGAAIPHVLPAGPQGPQLHLADARHPLLVLQLGRENTMANTLTLGAGDTYSHEKTTQNAECDTPIRTLVITGPNTGGKTVLLKMAGLLALMVRAGLPLPSSSQSALTLFQPVLAEIGDHQNIAQGLSSFSAHLTTLRDFLRDESSLENALILIDEIAAGTDPSEGAPLATALLDAFYRRGATTLVTTHWSDLKLVAHEHPGYLNASVEFDIETLSPTYRLMLGMPGTSNALNIAARLGLPADIIEAARRHLTQPVQDTANLIETLERKHHALQKELDQAESFRRETQAEYESVSLTRHQIEAEKRKVLSQFRTSLKSRLHVLESQVKRFRKTMLQNEDGAVSNPDHAVDRLQQLQKNADTIFQDTESHIESAPGLAASQIYVGQTLYSKKMSISGEVVDLSQLATDGLVGLQAGIMRMTLPVDDLQLNPGGRAPEIPRSARATSGGKETTTAGRGAASLCDVRGQRLQDALDQVTQFLDDAVHAGLEQVAIIHGLGTGTLKQHIRDYLRESSYVRSFQAAEAVDGGDGKTIIRLR